jgi:hypothetical protein
MGKARWWTGGSGRILRDGQVTRSSVLIVLEAALLAFTGGCARAFTGGPPGRWVATSPEGYRLVLAPEPTHGAAPLHVRLHTRIVGGPDETDPRFCPQFAWRLGDGSMATITAVCPGPPPGDPEGPVTLQRTLHVDNTYARRGSYRVRAFMQLHPAPNEVWLASEPVRIAVR